MWILRTCLTTFDKILHQKTPLNEISTEDSLHLGIVAPYLAIFGHIWPSMGLLCPDAESTKIFHEYIGRHGQQNSSTSQVAFSVHPQDLFKIDFTKVSNSADYKATNLIQAQKECQRHLQEHIEKP